MLQRAKTDFHLIEAKREKKKGKEREKKKAKGSGTKKIPPFLRLTRPLLGLKLARAAAAKNRN